MESNVIWDMMPCSLIDLWIVFFADCVVYSLTLKMGAICLTFYPASHSRLFIITAVRTFSLIYFSTEQHSGMHTHTSLFKVFIYHSAGTCCFFVLYARLLPLQTLFMVAQLILFYLQTDCCYKFLSHLSIWNRIVT
jgi:hypothetical protein